MIRFAVILSLLPLLAGTAAASAQTAADQRNSGCARDVAKYCRAKVKVSKKCAGTLAEHGQ